jgi:hypothetical protein
MRETIKQKITIGMLAAIVILLFILIFFVHINAADGVINTISIYGSNPIGGAYFFSIIPRLAEIYITIYFLSALVLCVIATAHIMPEAINSRILVLYLSKPLSRNSIILAIFFGTTMAITLVQLAFAASIWIILAAKTGILGLNILLSIIPLIFAFSALFALMVYVGIISKSTGIVTAMALGHVLMISQMLGSPGNYPGLSLGKPIGNIIWNLARIFLPGIYDMQNMAHSIMMSHGIDGTILLLSIFPCAFYLWLSIRAFRRMDF